MRYWPIVPTKDPNGHWVPESFISELKDGGKHKEQNDVLAQQVSLRVKPLDGLTVNVELNYRINNSNFHKDWLTTYGYDVDGNPYVTNNANSSVYEYNEKNNYFNPNVWAEYARSSGGHNVTLMAGFQSELLNERDFSAQQNGILSGLPTLNTTRRSEGPTTAGQPPDSSEGSTTISKDATCSRPICATTAAPASRRKRGGTGSRLSRRAGTSPENRSWNRTRMR